MSKTTTMIAALSLTLLATACKKEPEHTEGPMESAGEEVDETAGEVKEESKEAAEETGDALEEAGDNAEDATD